jgi:ABC-2 type transport system ATP-binding protein
MNAINVNKLYKSYNGIDNAIEDITFSIPAGEIFGFLGPNGSGKTTTVRILNGILKQTSGSANLYDLDNVKDKLQVHRISGVMTESARNYENLTALENLIFFGKLHHIEEKELKERAQDLLKKLELFEDRNKKAGDFSTGMKKRLALAIALINNPKIIFLDEPTSGLDPENAANVLNLIKHMAKEKEVTVFMCTHQLKYAQDICSMFGFIDKGKILGIGSFEELLKKKNAQNRLIIRGENIKESLAFNKLEENYYKEVSSDEEAYSIIKSVINEGGKIYEARQESWSLEDLYFSYIRGDKNE